MVIGLLLGALCGAVELYLLNLLASRITAEGNIPFWIVPAKMAALALFFVPIALMIPDQLVHAGIAAAAVLIGGAVILFLKRKRMGGETK